ncbi:MAG: DNA polymerase III subunit chi [Halieaceae bacterium]|jgi:DNA polymerase III subunit chi|nr:DNA polymerase III subunit chi [Halieaceae bacterium]
MTRIGFYVIQTADPDQRLHIAARLTDKAFQQGHRVFINSSNEPEARQLDELLWSFRSDSFLPHTLASSGQVDAITVGWGQEPQQHNDFLINLTVEIPAFFSRFQRVAEVVSQDPASLAASRKSWVFYKERGYQLEKHDL